MNSLNVKAGDTVVVITGKDKGKKGKVLESFPKTGRVLVEGTKAFKKNKKARSAQDAGGILNITGTMDVSNVMILCSKCGKPTRVGHSFDINGKKFRICKHKDCGASLEKARVKEDKKKKVKEETENSEKAVKKTAEKDSKVEISKPVKSVEEKPVKPAPVKTAKPETKIMSKTASKDPAAAKKTDK